MQDSPIAGRVGSISRSKQWFLVRTVLSSSSFAGVFLGSWAGDWMTPVHGISSKWLRLLRWYKKLYLIYYLCLNPSDRIYGCLVSFYHLARQNEGVVSSRDVLGLEV